MKRLKKSMYVSLFALGIALVMQPVYANESGGWDENSGFFVNGTARTQYPYPPEHHGETGNKTVNGTGVKWVEGWTNWRGAFHYTRAQVLKTSALVSVVASDSGRIWGTTYTSAYTEYKQNKFDYLSGKTFYGQ